MYVLSLESFIAVRVVVWKAGCISRQQWLLPPCARNPLVKRYLKAVSHLTSFLSWTLFFIFVFMKSFCRYLKSAVPMPPSCTGLLLSYSAWRNTPGCPRWRIVPVLGFHSIIPLCAFVLHPRKSHLIFLLIFSIFSPPLTEILRPLSTSRSFGQMTLMTLSLSECVCKCHFSSGKKSALVLMVCM